jgi:hypothetical protein
MALSKSRKPEDFLDAAKQCIEFPLVPESGGAKGYLRRQAGCEWDAPKAPGWARAAHAQALLRWAPCGAGLPILVHGPQGDRLNGAAHR